MSTLSVGTIQSNTSAPPVIRNSSNTEIGTFCRAWVNFNGTLVTNPASMTGVRASFNVSSILDNGVGDYTINFTNAMPDANYCVTASGNRTNDPGSTERDDNANFSPLVYSVGSIRGITGFTDSQRDLINANVAIFR